MVVGGLSNLTAGTKADIPGPAGSGAFGSNIRVLSNGHLLVIDSGFDLTGPTVSDVGAVYLYDPNGVLISSLRGSTAGDAVGSGGVVELENGNFVVISRNWDNAGVENAGAVTWGSMREGFIGGLNVVVSAANSLVGSQPGDGIGSGGVRDLNNGNYVVNSPLCANGTVSRAGASTWGNGETGIVGVVSLTNSLMGGTFQDSVGSSLRQLANSNYVIYTSYWTNPTTGAANAGAVTWANGMGGTVGLVSVTNSLVGSTADDMVSGIDVEALTNGNYVVSSSGWDNGTVPNVGAATWGNGTTGTSGPVTPANSIIGSTAGDSISSRDIQRLQNGNYVVVSPSWDNGDVLNAGAVTFARGNAPTSLVVGPANSLVGSSQEDQIGSNNVQDLFGGGYVVASPLWDNGTTVNAGAATWGSGTTGVRGVVSAVNSLVGNNTNDAIGTQIGGFTNGNYIVITPTWRGGTGAATWGSGTSGVRGIVSATNSLVGATAGDQIGSSGVRQLSNSNYVVSSTAWNGGLGAVTWGNGRSGVKGVVSAANSLVGGTAGDAVGTRILSLLNGHYVVLSPNWDMSSIAVTNAGAATWCKGTTGARGLVTAANSLTGTSPEDQVGFTGDVLANGSFVVNSPFWDHMDLGTTNAGAVTWADGQGPAIGELSLQNSLIGMTNEDRVGLVASNQSGVRVVDGGERYVVLSAFFDNPGDGGYSGVVDGGAVTLGNGQTGTTGFVTSRNSVLGSVAGQGGTHQFAYDSMVEQLFVGRPASQLVTIFVDGAVVSLARTKDAAPLVNRAFGAFGALSVNDDGGALFDTALSGSVSGNRALFGLTNPQSGVDVVLQKGDALSTLGLGLPTNAAAATLLSPITQQSGFGVFQATFTGTGVNATNNRLVLADNATGLIALLRTGSPISVLGSAAASRVLEVVESYDSDLVVASYGLRAGGTPAVTTRTDSGLLLFNHDGTALANVAAREGSPAFGGGGTFGPIAGRASVIGNEIHFPALFQPTTGKAVQALFSMTADGATTLREAMVGDVAEGGNGCDLCELPCLVTDEWRSLVPGDTARRADGGQ